MITYYVIAKSGPIKNVAFYDRASTPKQQTNYMRGVNCETAKSAAIQYGWDVVMSHDSRNDGVCHLDCGTGARWDNRPEFFRALDNPLVDTIAVVSLDRLARGVNALDALEDAVIARGKNLVCLTQEYEVEFHNKIASLIAKYSQETL